MQSSLLHAKLHRPASGADTIARPRLLRRLADGLACRVTFISAAAGFGKSTLISAWLDALIAQSDTSKAIKAGWLTLDAGDNTLPRFLRYLVAAIDTCLPRICAPVTALLQSNAGASVEDLADALTNALAALPGRLILVLDDLHTLDDAAIHAFLARFVQFAPPAVHLVLSARVDPRLPLNRWRAQGWLNELRQRELGFTLDEAGTFLRQGFSGDGPAPETVAALYRYTEGWPVGLRLAALALRGHADEAAFLADVAANGDRFALDYLRDDVLDQQPAAVQSFLLGTAILKRFCADLCAAVLQIDKIEAQYLLQSIVQANLFLVDLSTPAQWFRYHHQFQSMLLSKLSERCDADAIAEMHRRAAAWLYAHGELSEAVDYLLRIGDVDAAAGMVERCRVERVNDGRAEEVSDALAVLPEQSVNRRPWLVLSAAWVDAARLDWGPCDAKVARVEQALRDGQVDKAGDAHERMTFELTALRCAMDLRLEGKVTLAGIEAAWQHAQPHLAQITFPVVGLVAEQCQFLGNINLGLAMIDAALTQNSHWSPAARCDLLSRKATMLMWHCDLLASEHTCQTVAQMAEQHGLAIPLAKSQLTLAVIAGVRHQLEACERMLQRVLADPTLDNGKCAMLAVSRLLELYVYQRRLAEADDLVHQFRECARTMNLRYLHEHADAMEAYLALAKGDTAAALAWVLRGLRHGPAYHAMDRLPIIRARILVSEGSPASLNAALPILDAYLRYMERHHLHFYLVEGGSLYALALAGLGQMDRALAELSRAVGLAVPHGMVGRLIQRGQPMKRLLQTLSTHPTHAEQATAARLVLAIFGDETPALQPASVTPTQTQLMQTQLTQSLIEPLSERECDVLRLIATGLSNKQIAQRLTISVHTVRNHTANIFGKLQVANRMQAVERARAAGLLPLTARP